MNDKLSIGWMAAKQRRVLLLQVKQTVDLAAETRKANTADELLTVCAALLRVVELITDVLVQVALRHMFHSLGMAGKLEIFTKGAKIS
jgi:hypothetical protein